ncbi:MAG TPA: enoyl-CoA hydratase-related protein [Gaiellaceae bacterium]|nr:enoyl-CoA hydratase-related protein [Gaiellaceae bacterium]
MAELVLVDAPTLAVGVLTLNRPEVRNALSTELALALSKALRGLSASSDIRAIVLTGSGDRAFCAGADLKERDGMTDEAWASQHVVFEETCAALRDCSRPVIAAVNGVAAGGGLELAMSCDFVVASSGACFGQPEASRGIMPGLGGTQLLPRLVPAGLAAELLLTGRLVDADEALRAGLVTHVFAPDELLPSAVALAESIAASSPQAVAQIRRALRLGRDVPLAEALELELDCYRETATHPDRVEGIRAFNERRPPTFADPDS